MLCALHLIVKWVWVKIKPPADRRLLSLFPFTEVPFWVFLNHTRRSLKNSELGGRLFIQAFLRTVPSGIAKVVSDRVDERLAVCRDFKAPPLHVARANAADQPVSEAGSLLGVPGGGEARVFQQALGDACRVLGLQEHGAGEAFPADVQHPVEGGLKSVAAEPRQQVAHVHHQRVLGRHRAAVLAVHKDLEPRVPEGGEEGEEARVGVLRGGQLGLLLVEHGRVHQARGARQIVDGAHRGQRPVLVPRVEEAGRLAQTHRKQRHHATRHLVPGRKGRLEGAFDPLQLRLAGEGSDLVQRHLLLLSIDLVER